MKPATLGLGRTCSALALLLTLSGATSASPQSQRSYDAYDVRMNMLGIVDKLQRVGGTPFLDSHTRASLQAVRAEIEAAPAADLDRLTPIAAQLERLHASLGMLAGFDQMDDLRADNVRVKANLGDALPAAAYPDLQGDVENLIDAVVDAGDQFFDFRTDCIVPLLLDTVVGRTDFSFDIGIDVRDICGDNDACRTAVTGTLSTFGLCCGFNIGVNLDPVLRGFIDSTVPSDLGSVAACRDAFAISRYATGDFDTSAADPLLDRLEGLGFQNLGRCDTDTRSATLAAFLTRTAEIMAEAARDIADKVCNQDFGVTVGFNLSVACIPIDVLNILAKGIDDNLALCDSFVDSAEINGTFVRMEALHDQVGSAFAALGNVRGDLAAHDEAVDTQLASNRAALSGAIAGSASDVLDALGDHDAAIQGLLAASRTFFLGLELEEALIRRERDAVYYLPQAQGGNLEVARALVQQAIERVADSGQDTHDAAGLLAQADAAIAGARYKVGFDLLASAYFEAVKVRGENQPSPRSER